MDQRERLNDREESLRTILDGFQARVWTALPAIVQSFDPATCTVKVQPSIQGKLKNIRTGIVSDVRMPLCTECPVVFPGGGGFVLTFPITSGDEGLLVFACRSIDAWYQSGGVQVQAEYRMHDLSDGFFLPGVFSLPRVPTGIDASSTQLRSSDGLTVVELDGNVCNITAAGGINLIGPVSVQGAVVGSSTIHSTGDITTDAAVKANGAVEAGVGGIDHVTLQGHVHISGVAGFNTQPPTAGT